MIINEQEEELDLSFLDEFRKTTTPSLTEQLPEQQIDLSFLDEFRKPAKVPEFPIPEIGGEELKVIPEIEGQPSLIDKIKALPQKTIPFVKETVVPELLKGVKGAGEEVLGLGEAGVHAVSGLASFPISVAGGILYKTFGKDISWQEAERKKHEIADLFTHEPLTEKGRIYSEILMSPFAALSAGIEGIKRIGGGEEAEAMIGFAAETALLTLAPAIKGAGKSYIKSRVKANKPIEISKVKEYVNKTEEIPIQVKEQVNKLPDIEIKPKLEVKPEILPEKIKPIIEPRETEIKIDVSPKPEGGAGISIKIPEPTERLFPKIPEEIKPGAPRVKTDAEVAMEAMEAREGRYIPRARPEYKPPPKVEKRMPEERIREQQRIIEAEEDLLRATGKKPEQIEEFRKNEFMDGEEISKITKDVITGKLTRDKAVSELKGLIEKTVEKPEVGVPTIKGFVDKNITKSFEDLNVPREYRGDIYEDALRNLREPTKESLEGLIKSRVGRFKAGERVRPRAEEPISIEEVKEPIIPEKEAMARKLEKIPERKYEVDKLFERTEEIIDREIKDTRARKIIRDTLLSDKKDVDIASELGISRQRLSQIKKDNAKVIDVLMNDPEIASYAVDTKVKAKAKDKLLETWEVHAGYPFTKEIKNAIGRIREKQKIKKSAKLEEIKKELQKTDEGKVEWMFIETDMKLKEKGKPTFKRAFGLAKHALVDTSGTIKTRLIKDLGDLGKEAVIHHDLIAGANAKAEMMFTKASKEIYKDLSKREVTLLNRAIQARRTVVVSKYKPDVKHPLGLTAKEHTEYLKRIPEEINKRAGLYFKEMEKVLDNLKDEGLISAESYKELKSKGDYSPRRFIQYIDPESSYSISGRTITIPDSGIKVLDEGSYNVMETNSRLLLSNVIARTQARIFRNRANKSAYNIAEKLPDNEIFKLAKVIRTTKEGKPIYQPAPAGETKIKVMIDGKAKEIIMPNEYAKEWLTRDPLINEQVANTIGWLSGSKILKPMATGLNPGFALTNFPRDIAHVFIVTSEYSKIPERFAFQIGRDFLSTTKDSWLRKGRWLDYIDEGGGMTFLTHQGRIFEKIPFLKSFEKVMGYLGETSEIWTRLALRERAIRNGKSPTEATWEARNYLDFSQGGNVSKLLDTGIPYLNAGIQGTRGIFRAFADRPAQTLYKFAHIGAIATGLYLANKYVNPDCYNSIPDYEKVGNFIITTPFSIIDKNGNKRYFYFKVAKDQGQRIACTIFENLMAKEMGEDVDTEQITQAISDFLPIIPSEKLPPSFDAMFGYLVNKDFWIRKDIWKGAKITPREEYTIYTHPALVKAGKITGLSPERLEYSLSQFFTRGNIYTSLVSGGLNSVMKDLPEEDKRRTLAEIVTRLPLIKRVCRLTPPYSQKEIKELKETTKEESTRRYKQKRELNRMANEYYRKLKDEKTMDKPLLNEIKSFIREQPKEDRERLNRWFKNYGIMYAIPDRTWWLNLTGMPPETRATVFWTKYLEADDEKEKQELKRLAMRLPGIWSDRFVKKLRILMSKAK